MRILTHLAPSSSSPVIAPTGALARHRGSATANSMITLALQVKKRSSAAIHHTLRDDCPSHTRHPPPAKCASRKQIVCSRPFHVAKLSLNYPIIRSSGCRFTRDPPRQTDSAARPRIARRRSDRICVSSDETPYPDGALREIADSIALRSVHHVAPFNASWHAVIVIVFALRTDKSVVSVDMNEPKPPSAMPVKQPL